MSCSVPAGDPDERAPARAHGPERLGTFGDHRPDPRSTGPHSASTWSAGLDGLGPAAVLLAAAAGDGAAPRSPRRKAHQLALLYALLALVSIAMNLGTQQVAVVTLGRHVEGVLPLSVLCGTAAGFASKYLLDKKFIFFDVSADGREEARKVALYGVFSVFTTALFWGVEGVSFALFGTAAAKYTGAVVGLVLGYALKFALDRRFTFTTRGPAGSPDGAGDDGPTPSTDTRFLRGGRVRAPSRLPSGAPGSSPS